MFLSVQKLKFIPSTLSHSRPWKLFLLKISQRNLRYFARVDILFLKHLFKNLFSKAASLDRFMHVKIKDTKRLELFDSSSWISIKQVLFSHFQYSVNSILFCSHIQSIISACCELYMICNNGLQSLSLLWWALCKNLQVYLAAGVSHSI